MSDKKLSRRDFLKAVGATAAIAAAPKVNMPFATSSRLQGTVVLKIQSFAHEALEAVMPEFSDLTGFTVELESGVSSGVEHLTEVTTAYAAGDSPWDVVSDADESGPVLARAGWLTPLDDIIPEETWADYSQGMQDTMMQGYGYDGSLYRVPHEFACGYFFYRKDLLDEMGLEVPTTWDEIIEVGTQVTDKENNVWATLDAISKGGLLWVYLAYLTSQTGGSIFDVDEGTIEAIQFLYDMIHTHEIFPEDALNMNYDQQNEMYMDDRVMFMRQWPYCQAVFESDEEWFAPEKAVITLPPGGSAGPGSWWGGWGFTLPSMAPNPEGAQELIKFITSPEIAPKLAEGQSWFIMPRTSILEAFADKDDAIVNAMGMYADAGVIKPRPFHARAAEAQVAFEDGIALYLTDQESLEDAVEIAKTLIAELDEE